MNGVNTSDFNSNHPHQLSFLPVSGFPSSYYYLFIILESPTSCYLYDTSDQIACYHFILLPAAFGLITCIYCLFVIGWEPGPQEGLIEWDEDWDKFEDEG